MSTLSGKFIGNKMKTTIFLTTVGLFFIFIVGLPCIGLADSVGLDEVSEIDSADHIAGPMNNPDKGVEISIGKFLSTAFDDPSLASQNERNRFLTEAPGGISFIEDPEFRISIDKFETNQQKYALRCRPRGWDEIKGEKTLYHARVECGAMELDYLMHLALKNRYMVVLDSLYFSEMKTLYEALNLLYEDWEHVLKRHADRSDFDAGELAAIENQRMALQMELMELKTQQDSVAEKRNLQSNYGATAVFDADQLLSVDELSKRFAATHIHSGEENIYLAQAKTEVAKTEAQYRLEVAEEKRLISFVETAYNVADEDDFQDAFSIELGISIPIGSGNRDSIRQQKLKSMISRSEQQALEREINHKISVIDKKLQQLIEQYTAVQQKKKNRFSTAAFDRLLQTKGTDPLILLKLKKGLLKMDVLQAKLSHRIFTTYIEFLDITGKLSERPLINHLSPVDKEPLVQ